MTSTAAIKTIGQIAFLDLEPSQESFLDAVLEGLGRSPKALPSKFFYDEKGSHLFARITKLDEYYPTRTEMRLLRDSAAALSKWIPEGAQLIEFGSGSNDKVRLMLDEVGGFGSYVPIDISRDFLLENAAELAQDHPDLEITAVCADYTKDLVLPDGLLVDSSRRVGFFPGSTIGNLEPEPAVRFLRRAARILGEGAGFLVGADLRKKPERLDAAYNDSQGVTAAFNLNLLSRINGELGADFDVDNFAHVAFFNEALGRVEMHLESRADQTVTIDGHRFAFSDGERIHTENSYKYTIDGFQDLARGAGLTPLEAWTDRDQLFSIHLFRV